MEVGPELSSWQLCEVGHGQREGLGQDSADLDHRVGGDEWRRVMEVLAEAWESINGALAWGKRHASPPWGEARYEERS
ncbi:hypothetical protein ACFQ2B_36300 [Streptomyces stramineus]|uniref:Uncharacterized protein n=1 Tax=Streptomyces stramineus TaxID=173861 RepID=A0ABN0ZDY4_9ACTN